MHEKDHHEPGTAPRTDRATPSRGPRGHRRLPGALKGRGRPHALPDRPGYPGRQRRADPDPTASSWSELGHDEHFLQRVLRCEGIDLERAMRLYHHSVVMRRIVPELMKALPPHHERAAIPLRKTTPSPHVVVTRKGAFVTCLSAPMGVGRLPVLPVAPIDEEIRRADLEQERLRRLPALFAALPLKKLVRALYQGPGALTREMVQIIEKDVWAFEPLLIRVFIHFLRQFCGNERDRKRLGYRRWLEIERVKIDTQIRQGLLLLGLVDSADLAQRFEPRLFELFTSTMAEAAALMARKPGRAKALLELVKNREGASNWVRGGATDALLLHCVWFPEEAKWALPALLELEPPRRYTAWYAVLIPNEAAARKDTAATVRSFLGHFGPGSKLQPLEYPEKAPYACTMRQLILHACHRTPVSQHFPPASEAAQQARGFAEYLRARPERDPALKPGKPVVLEAPRVGRNQPCPCGSGEKFKRCCLGKPAAPASTAAAAANPPAAEHSSAKESAP